MAGGAFVLGASVVCGVAGIAGTSKMSVFEAFASKGSEEEIMPHISVKLFPGRSEETKQRLAEAIVENVVNIAGCGKESVSVSIEEVSSAEWKEEVYDPEIRDKKEYLYKKPGYSM
jgi:4-oxalocrotonate tautomerase